MNTDINSYKANVIKRPFIKLIRKKSSVVPNTYELNTASICKLVDCLSSGNFIQYSGCSLKDGDVYIDYALSFHCMSYCLAETLDSESVQRLFGEVSLVSPEDFESYIQQFDIIKSEDKNNIIKDFIKSKYDIDLSGEYKFVRKPNSIYKNY